MTVRASSCRIQMDSGGATGPELSGELDGFVEKHGGYSACRPVHGTGAVRDERSEECAVQGAKESPRRLGRRPLVRVLAV